MSSSNFPARRGRPGNLFGEFRRRIFTVSAAFLAAFLCAGPAAAGPAEAATAATGTAAPVVMCLEDSGDSRAAGAEVLLASCDGSPAQNWTWAGSSLKINGLCLASSAGAAVLEACGGQGQQWADKGSELVSVQSGQCLTDPHGSTVDGTPLDLEPCHGGLGQQLALPVPTSSATTTWVLIVLVALLLIGLVFLLSTSAARRLFARLMSPRPEPTIVSGAVEALDDDDDEDQDEDDFLIDFSSIAVSALDPPVDSPEESD